VYTCVSEKVIPVETISGMGEGKIKKSGGGVDSNIYLFIFFAVLEFELRDYTLSHSTSPLFLMGFLKIGSQEIFAQVGFQP
jgi:hypothetical protein